ncbi:N-acetyltransferase [Azorhizobium oxalatiphilum]|uniref:N-acetyltransferase n=1 Tax=Azorhizobium oxalatiphilum TaxID=980631 RepID=A0A917FGS5_9HYPH|nr:GNAT family N-acetyltransferase [Azorhizobium oxalatiphilum]GGF81408.1 N-acetyltransferase [Azorhizobium oxalatiphilum]
MSITSSRNPSVPEGYSPVTAGQLATVVTCLDMTERPVPGAVALPPGVTLEHEAAPAPAAYRQLYRLVGEDWLWSSRLVMGDDELIAILHDPRVEVHVLRSGGAPAGILELDFREPDACEIAFFGIAPAFTGSGLGRHMMHRALELAWSRPIARLWLHTCHLDHPAALAFYQRTGFRPYARMVEVLDDPRLSGILPLTAAPHIPLLR